VPISPITVSKGRKMPYSRISKLPDRIKDSLPVGAQKIFKEAFNNAWKQYSQPEARRGDASREEVANKVAWSAVKKKYKKDPRGEWVKKDG